jgi:potassium efflux system protein
MSNLNIAALHGCRGNHRHRFVPEVTRRAMLFWLLSACLLLLPVENAWSADTAASADVVEPSSGSVNAETLNARLKEVESSKSLDEETRSSITEMINKALANLETARNNKVTTEEYIRLRESAPEMTKKIRAVLEEQASVPPEVKLTVTRESPFEDIERELLQEKANLAAVKAKLADIETQLETSKTRPSVIPKTLASTKQARKDLEAERNAPAPEGELAWVTEARRWAQDARLAALRSEINLLDQELLTLPFKVEKLEAQRDQEAASIKRINARIALLEELSSRQGRVEAREAVAAADAAVEEAAGKHTLIQQLAEENARLTREAAALASTLKRTSDSDGSVDRDAKRIEDNFRQAREQLDVAGLSNVLGEVLGSQRQDLPDRRVLRTRLSELEDENARMTLELIQQASERKRLASTEEYVAGLTQELTPEVAALVTNDLTELVLTRRDLLDKSISLHKSYLRSLRELTASYRRLLDNTVSYDEFLAKNLLWIRSAPPPGLETLTNIPDQLALMFAPSRWRQIPGAITAGVLASVWVKLLLVLFAVLMWKISFMRKQLLATGEPVGKVAHDKFSYTLQALGLTFLIALPWPLLTFLLGLALESGPAITVFSAQLADALKTVAPTYFYIQFFSALCLPGGVAAKHFRWPDSLSRALHVYFFRLKIALLPAILVIILAVDESQTAQLDSVERIALVFALLVTALFFYRVSHLLLHTPVTTQKRQRYFWLGLTVAAPLVLAVLAFIGYFYTAGMLGSGLIRTFWIAFGLVILHQTVVRWLLVTQRRMALQAARDRLQAAREEKESAVDAEMDGSRIQVEEPEVDLVALSDETRKLISMMLVILGFVGFLLVWSEILPAFSVLDDVTLWHKTSVVAGEEALVPVSLGDLAIALLIAFLTYMAMKRLPPLLEILLLQRVDMTSGARYTAKTLYTYAIVGVGLVAFFSFIGMDWSRLQWLIAALGVGIGFGLQEIVANFISGLIILFERPIRVGDVVTVGDTEGAVSRIQIRATTIRTWDGQELLVPNKEFITGRLLNWSLSDQTTRLKIPVGIAYGSDVQQAMKLMDDAARQNETVLSDPAPYIMFLGFGDNALQLELRCFVGVQSHRLPAITNLHEVINRYFNEAGISISFPQRDVHLDATRPLDVRIHRDDEQGSGA